MKRRGAFALATLLALTACAGARAPGPAERQTAPPQARTVTAPANRISPAPSAPKLRISDLVGRTPAQIDTLIGIPDLVRREGDGEVRIHRSNACVLHVFAYPRGGVPQATHIEARTPNGQIVGDAAEECLAGFAPS